MFRLIKNELFKLFHKKSIYIFLIVAVGFLFLVNYLYSLDLNTFETYTYEFELQDASDRVSYLEEYDKDSYELPSAKAMLDMYTLLKDYHETWQESALNGIYYEAAIAYYDAFYNKTDNVNEKLAQKQDLESKIKNDDWRYFTNIQLNSEKENLASLKESITNNKQEENELNRQIAISEETIKVYEYALNNDVPMDSSYQGEALQNILDDLYPMMDYKYNNEKEAYEEILKNYEENWYILNEKMDTNNSHTLRYVIMNLYNELEIIVIVFCIMVAGGMVADEFNKGTIKNLLTIPYTRGQILASKLITSLLMLPFIILFLLVGELIIGGLFFGYSSLSIPVVNYMVSDGSFNTLNVFSYFGLIVLTKAPMVILLLVLAFSLSTIVLNTAFAITITFLGYVGSSIINMFAQSYNLKFLNYFVTTNWDFSVHLFGGVSEFNIPISQSIMVCLVYLLIMLVVTFMVFKKKNIKNI